MDDLEREWSEQNQSEPSLLENIKEEKDAPLLDSVCGELENNNSKPNTNTNINNNITNVKEKDYQNYFDSFF